jgi:ubiquinone/menaquinone biosynthesis C-methylase UbiE
MTLPQVNFDREKQWWDAKAAREEVDFVDARINRELRWRELEKHLSGINTILDIGGSTGAFAIPLAQRGFDVTLLDISPAMLELARQKAKSAGLDQLRILEGNAVDLSIFPDHSFDLVLNMDGAISFCGSQALQALQESCRVCRRKLIVTVSHRAQMAAVLVNSSIKVLGHVGGAAKCMLEKGEWHQDQFAENTILSTGMAQNYMGPLRAFLPYELRQFLNEHGMKILRCGGLGSLAYFCGSESIEAVLKDEHQFQKFLDYCEYYDLEVLPDGPGTRQRAGLIAVAEVHGTDSNG